MRPNAQTVLGAVLFASLLAPVGFLLVGGVLIGLTGIDRVATWGGYLLGFPLGAVAGWRVGRRLTPRAPRLVCTAGGLLAGGFLGALPGLVPILVLAASRPPRRPTPEAFTLNITGADVALGCLFVLGLLLGTIIGAVWGYRVGARTPHAPDPSHVPQPVDSPHPARPE